jgi:hypothetical protein
VARVFNQTCAPIGDEIPIAMSSGIQNNPRGAVDLDGRWAVVWEQDIHTLNVSRFDVNNGLLSTTVVNMNTNEGVSNPDITFTTEKHLIITWASSQVGGGGDESGTASKAVELDYFGERVNPEWLIHRTYTGDQDAPKVVGRPNGTFVYMWESDGQDGDGEGIIGRLSNSGECQVDSDCNDQNICTTNQCLNNTCINSNNSNLCVSDGNSCTVDDQCVAGTCQGTLIECNDFNICTEDACDPDTGQCASDPIPWCNGGCYYSDEPGCDGCNCEAQVCAEKPTCCSENWGSICVQLCNQKYGGCDSP